MGPTELYSVPYSVQCTCIVYLQTAAKADISKYENLSEIPIKFPLIWYVLGLSRL